MSKENKHWWIVLSVGILIATYFGFRSSQGLETIKCVDRENSRLEYMLTQFSEEKGDSKKKEDMQKNLNHQLKIVEMLKNSLITEQIKICEIIKEENEIKKRA